MTTACCHGHPSPFLQDSTLLINPSSSPSPDPCQHIDPKTPRKEDWSLPAERSFGFPSVPHGIHIRDSSGASDPRSGTGKTCRRSWILTGAVFCLIAIVISVTISCLLMRNIIQGNGLDSGSGGKIQMNTCVPCNPGKGQDLENRIDSTNNVFCCVSDDSKMQQLIIEGVRLSLQDRLKGEELYALLNNPMLPPPINKDAAHVFFRPIKQRPKRPNAYLDQSQSDDFETLRDWSSVGESAFIRSGVEFNSTRGHFRVKNTGIYVIYSRIVYEGNADDDDDDGDVTSVFGHSISLYQRSSYRVLLEDEQAAVCHRRTVCYNSQIFSALHLIKDSQVAVRAMRLGMVSPRAHASYFGLYKID